MLLKLMGHSAKYGRRKVFPMSLCVRFYGGRIQIDDDGDDDMCIEFKRNQTTVNARE
jgi:hypothetical protein